MEHRYFRSRNIARTPLAILAARKAVTAVLSTTWLPGGIEGACRGE
jgi:hypothetical protein